MATLFGLFPFLRKLFADGAYDGPVFHGALADILPRLETEIVKRSDRLKGFVVLPRRWVVERSIGWLNRCRRLAKDWECLNRNALAPLHSSPWPRSASCSESSAILHEVSGRTLSGEWSTLAHATSATSRNNDTECTGGDSALTFFSVVQSRIDQLRVNLERARWFVPGLPHTYLAVNIAGARVYLMRSGATVFESRTVVGALSTRTPVFRAVLSQVVLNPTWTVPRSIVGEVLSAIRRDDEYLARNGFRVVDRAGVRIDDRRVNFSHYTGATFPYVFVQDPGAANPLGRIKLVFPNRYNVYLHDTPARALFGREQRTFSHGCIRVEDPVRLGSLVLQGQGRWTPDAITSAIAAGTTVTIPVSAPLPVLILYWTAATDLHGELHYYSDVYGRDAQLLREIDRR